MKTEDFDEAIRKKVESIDHKFTEKDIDQVVQHLGRNRVFKGKGISGSTLIYSLVAAAATGLLAWYLLKDNGNLQQSTETPSSISYPANDSLPKTNASEDTFTLNIQTPVQPSDSAEKSETGPSLRDEKLTSVKPGRKDETSGTAQKIYVATTGETKSSVGKIIPETQAVTATAANLPVADTLKPMPPVILPEQRSEPPSTLVMDTLIPVAPGEIDSQTAVEELPKVEETPVGPKQEEITPLPQDESAVSGTESPKKGGSGNQFFAFSDFMAGAGFELASKNLGIGFTGELSFAERLRFSSGVKYLSYQEVKFENKEDFDRHNHRKINHRFEDHLKDKEHASEISIHSTLIQLPLAFRYQIPLRNNFSFLFSLGTDLDLVLNQQLSYNQGSDSLGHHPGKFDASGDAVLFNNIVISAGVKKQWKHLVLQAHPFMRPQLKQVFYKPKEFDFGLGVSLLYRF